jgi:hypothetical protein
MSTELPELREAFRQAYARHASGVGTAADVNAAMDAWHAADPAAAAYVESVAPRAGAALSGASVPAPSEAAMEQFVASLGLGPSKPSAARPAALSSPPATDAAYAAFIAGLSLK